MHTEVSHPFWLPNAAQFQPSQTKTCFVVRRPQMDREIARKAFNKIAPMNLVLYIFAQ